MVTYTTDTTTVNSLINAPAAKASLQEGRLGCRR